MIDIHCHLLPGIDDGPRSWEEAVDLCKALLDDGISTAVATPHLIDGVYNNTNHIVGPLVTELNERLHKASIALTVLTGAEVDFSSRLVTSPSAELPTLGSGRSVLLEMPVAVVPPALVETVFTLQARGLRPVLAHPERNEHVQDNPSLVDKWIESGVAVQVDAESILGLWGRRTQDCAERIILRGTVHALASDSHSVRKRPPRLRDAVARAVELVGDDALELVDRGPEIILRGTHPVDRLYAARVDDKARSPRRRSKKSSALTKGSRLRRLFSRR